MRKAGFDRTKGWLPFFLRGLRFGNEFVQSVPPVFWGGDEIRLWYLRTILP